MNKEEWIAQYEYVNGYGMRNVWLDEQGYRDRIII